MAFFIDVPTVIDNSEGRISSKLSLNSLGSKNFWYSPKGKTTLYESSTQIPAKNPDSSKCERLMISKRSGGIEFLDDFGAIDLGVVLLILTYRGDWGLKPIG